jgi:hypothetical protein
MMVDDVCALALPEASVTLSPLDTLGSRPQRSRRGPTLGRSHLGESECGVRRRLSPVPMDAGLTSALLLARTGCRASSRAA